MSVIVTLRRSDRGSQDLQGDIVFVSDGADTATLPPPDAFWVVKITGVEVAEFQQYTAPQYDENGNLIQKRVWQLRTNRVPSTVVNYILAHGFVGFGAPEDQVKYGAIVEGDMLVQWTDVQGWIVNKTSGRTINNRKA